MVSKKKLARDWLEAYQRAVAAERRVKELEEKLAKMSRIYTVMHTLVDQEEEHQNDRE